MWKYVYILVTVIYMKTETGSVYVTLSLYLYLYKQRTMNRYVSKFVLLSNFVNAVLVPSDRCCIVSWDRFDLCVIPHPQPHIVAPRRNERTDRPLACSLLERRSSLHPFFIIGSSVRSSVKRSCYSLMFTIHLHHALCHDKRSEGVVGMTYSLVTVEEAIKLTVFFRTVNLAYWIKAVMNVEYREMNTRTRNSERLVF